MRVLDFQKRGDHAALPVVRMQDIGTEVQQRQGVEAGTAEEAVALVLVAAQTVDVGPPEVILVIEEIIDHAIFFEHLHAAVLPAPAQLNVKVQQVLHLLLPLLGDGGVHWQNDAHIVAFLGQHGRQRAHHVRQAARLDKWAHIRWL